VIAPLVIFIATYAVVAATLNGRALLRLAGVTLGALAMIAFGPASVSEAFRDAISWKTLGLLLGMMLVSSSLQGAGWFEWVAAQAVRRARSRKMLLALIVAASGVLSALLVNDTVCVMCTPIVLAIAEAAQLPAIPFLLALAFAANAGSAATLTGNPQNMLVGSLAPIRYGEFVKVLALPALVSLLTVLCVLLLLFRAQLRQPLQRSEIEPRRLDKWPALVSLLVLIGVIAAFLAGADLAKTALLGGALALLFTHEPRLKMLRRVDGSLLMLFASLFVVTYGVGKAGIAERAYDSIAPLLGTSVDHQMFTFGLFTLGACQLVSNVPFVMLAAQWMPKLSQPHIQWMALALVSTLAGNLTPIASVANLIVLQGAGDKGRIPFLRFLLYGAFCTVLPLLLSLACLLLERGYLVK
jgi:Na+/H+ antiporter NhaD/arsenite permease-like protein